LAFWNQASELVSIRCDHACRRSCSQRPKASLSFGSGASATVASVRIPAQCRAKIDEVTPSATAAIPRAASST